MHTIMGRGLEWPRMATWPRETGPHLTVVLRGLRNRPLRSGAIFFLNGWSLHSAVAGVFSRYLATHSNRSVVRD